MGTDIHMFLEFRIGGGEWYVDAHHQYAEEFEEVFGHKRLMKVPAARRDYNIFNELAGVRGTTRHNIYGAFPKGLPDDVSKEVLAECMRCGGDAHSHSYMSYEELRKVLYPLVANINDHITSRNPFIESKQVGLFRLKQKQWPTYYDIIAYCEDVITEHEIERFLFENDPGAMEARVVFWFDN